MSQDKYVVHDNGKDLSYIIYEALLKAYSKQKESPSRELSIVITKLEEAQMWQQKIKVT